MIGWQAIERAGFDPARIIRSKNGSGRTRCRPTSPPPLANV